MNYKINTDPKFKKQVLSMLTKKLTPVFEEAKDKGYVQTITSSPDTTGKLRTRLSMTAPPSGEKTLIHKGFSFIGLSPGQKEGLRRMQYGYIGYESVDAPEIQEWIKAVISKTPRLEKYFSRINFLPVGFNYTSRYFGGGKNPIQIGKTESKLYLENKLKIKFKKK